MLTNLNNYILLRSLCRYV